jgi:hypothetical protein
MSQKRRQKIAQKRRWGGAVGGAMIGGRILGVPGFVGGAVIGFVIGDEFKPKN